LAGDPDCTICSPDCACATLVHTRWEYIKPTVVSFMYMQRAKCRLFAGSKRVSVPGTRISLHPAHNPYPAAALLFLFLGLAFASVQYLDSEQRRKAELEATALTPESIIGEAAVMQQQDQAWPVDYGQGIPQEDASSLPVDRTMQQPRGENLQRQGTEDLFRSIRDLKQKLYGSNADVTIKGQRDLATAAAEVDR